MPDQLNFLSLIVAHSAYLAAIRFYAMQRLASNPSNAKSLKKFLFKLIFADAPLVLAGVLLTIQLFLKPLLADPAPWQSITWWVSFLFCCAVLVLAFYHLQAWLKSIQEYCKSRYSFLGSRPIYI